MNAVDLFDRHHHWPPFGSQNQHARHLAAAALLAGGRLHPQQVSQRKARHQGTANVGDALQHSGTLVR
ncbi:hypothetical protein D3C80_2167690 [compost metagenome]